MPDAENFWENGRILSPKVHIPAFDLCTLDAVPVTIDSLVNLVVFYVEVSSPSTCRALYLHSSA